MQIFLKNIRCLVWVFALIILISARSEGQFSYYDSLTYSHYKNEDWSQLIKSSKKALKENHDYYYLRMRRGIAFYNRQNYLLAEKNFNKANEFNSPDPVSSEYIYYSRLFAGKEKEASLYFFKNENLLKEQVKNEQKAISGFSATAIYKTSLQDELSDQIESDEIQNVDGSQMLTLNMKIASFLLTHDLSKNIRLFHGGTFLNKTSFLYLKSGGITYQENIKNITQYQYYGGIGLYPGRDFSFFSSLHYVFYNFPEIIMRGQGMGSNILLPSTKSNFYSARFSAYKQITLVKLGSGLSFSNLNDKDQLQWDGHFIFYPLGNRNLYLISSFYRVEEKDDVAQKTYLSNQNTLGLKLIDKLWLEWNLKTGESRNLVMQDGFGIYNSDEIETLGINFSTIIPGDKRTFRIMFAYSEYYNFFRDAFIMETDLNKTYSNSISIIGELKWNF